MDASDLPRWRGFNLLEKFTLDRNDRFREEDFEWIADWGFDFVRLPMDYRCWTGEDWTDVREDALAEVDEAVEYGRQHGVHVNLNFHRGPGYCVNPPEEPVSLWDEGEALDVCAEHWRTFAERYRGIDNEHLSFDLLNEPARTDRETYERVARRLVSAIREEDEDRLVVADGIRYGRDPMPGLADLDVAQSTRGYDPMRVSHHRASWIDGAEEWEAPSWPLEAEDGTWDQQRLREECIEPWRDLEDRGVGVHVGEWGAYQETPHDVALAWMEDFLELWEEVGWGWALWNFRGAFGVLDSGRDDVDYEDWHGHDLDREMLELLREH